MKTLIVEDDAKILDLLEQGLREAGLVVDQATNGILALEKIQSGSFDVIILDVMLPELDGLSLLTKIREQKINTPVLLLSAKKSLEERIEGLQKGGDDYLVKPFAFAELLARVQALYRRANPIETLLEKKLVFLFPNHKI